MRRQQIEIGILAWKKIKIQSVRNWHLTFCTECIHNSDPRLKLQERGDICAPSSTIRLSPLFIKKLLCTLESWPWRWPAEKNKKLPTLHLTKEEAKNKEFFKARKGGNYNITQNPWDTLQIFQKTGSTFLPMIPFGQPVKKPITHFPSQISIS